ncbi:MAG: chromosome partitioning protein ParB, partial [Pseudomonadota bacterium]
MARKSDRKALGRGLSALLGDAAASGALAPSNSGPKLSGDTNEIPIDLINANPDQPRRTFREEDLAEL